MNLSLKRDIFSPTFTLGQLSIDGIPTFFTVERPYLNGANTPGKACILPGHYQIVITASPKFHKLMPRLLNVPERDGILVHPANESSELAGCIAIGLQRTKDGVGASRVAFDDFYHRLSLALEKSKVWITIE